MKFQQIRDDFGKDIAVYGPEYIEYLESRILTQIDSVIVITNIFDDSIHSLYNSKKDAQKTLDTLNIDADYYYLDVRKIN